MTIGHLLVFIIIAALIISVFAAIVAFMLLARLKELRKELGELRLEHNKLRTEARENQN